MTHYKTLLQFSDRWLELGIVTEEQIEELGREYDESEDKNTEHYRYSVFREYLAAHSPLPPATTEALYELGEQDLDAGMGAAMMHDVVRLRECPASLRQRALASGDTSLVRLVRRQELLAELEGGLSPEFFERCLAAADPALQRGLLAEPALSRGQLERLAEAGVNRAIRNLAAVRLRDGKYKQR